MRGESFLAGTTSLDETHGNPSQFTAEFCLVQIKNTMKKDKIIYWVATGLLAAGMSMSAFMYLSKNAELMASFQQLGFPAYFVSILGIAKLAGVILLLAPSGDRLKEWAYAGFVFTFGGAIWTHIATGTPWIAPAVFLALLAVSYVFHMRLQHGSRSKSTPVRAAFSA